MQQMTTKPEKNQEEIGPTHGGNHLQRSYQGPVTQSTSVQKGDRRVMGDARGSSASLPLRDMVGETASVERQILDVTG